MATRRPIVLVNGQLEEIPSGDTISPAIAPGSGGGGGAAPVSVTVDFGSAGGFERTFDVAVAGATVGQKVVATPSLDMPAGVSEDELEMDMLACAGRVVSSDTVRLTVASLRGLVTRARNINLLVG